MSASSSSTAVEDTSVHEDGVATEPNIFTIIPSFIFMSTLKGVYMNLDEVVDLYDDKILLSHESGSAKVVGQITLRLQCIDDRDGKVDKLLFRVVDVSEDEKKVEWDLHIDPWREAIINMMNSS